MVDVIVMRRFPVAVLGSRQLVRAHRDLIPFPEHRLVPETRLVHVSPDSLSRALVPYTAPTRLSPDHEAILLAFLADAIEELLGPAAAAYTNRRRLGGAGYPQAISTDAFPSPPPRSKAPATEPRRNRTRAPCSTTPPRAASADRARWRRQAHRTLRAELADLERASKDAYSLIKHIYTKHPPRGKVHVQPEELSAETVKKAVRNALRDYHPDRQRAAAPGDEKWYVLCVEITKALTARHDVLRATT